MLVDRLRTSALLIGILAALLYLDTHYSRPGAEGLWLLPMLLFFAGGTAWDLCGLLRSTGNELPRALVIAATLVVSLSAGVPILWPLFGVDYPINCPVGRLGWIVMGGITAIFLVLINEMRIYGRPAVGGAPMAAAGPAGGTASEDARPASLAGQVIWRVAAGSFAALYVGLPMGLLVATRSLGDGNWGLAALLTLIAVTKSADAGAYFSGKSLGRNKLVPRLSPKKTWEGLLGGIVMATVVAYVCLRWLFPAVAGGANPPGTVASVSWLTGPIGGALLLGPLLAIGGLVGDLAESLIKRDAGAKDSGDLLPGLGGVWDVTDSLIAAALPAYLAFAAGVGW